jgi:hypothetical protein
MTSNPDPEKLEPLGTRPSPAPRYMIWYRGRSGRPPVLAGRVLTKSGKKAEKMLASDRGQAVRLMKPFLKQLIRDGQLDRDSDAAKLYVHGTITEAELEPTYMFWVRRFGRWRCQIRLKNGKLFGRALDPDRKRAEVRTAELVKTLVAAGQLDHDNPVVKRYSHHTVTEADPLQVLKAERGMASVKAPPCMRWMLGTLLIDDGPFHRRVKGPVLWSNVILSTGKTLQVNLNTNDEKVAAQRLRPHVVQAIANGALHPNSKAARLYGGADAVAPLDSGIAAAKINRAKDRGGRPSKWKDGSGMIAPDAKVFFEVVFAQAVRGSTRPSSKSVSVAIERVYNQIPLSQRTASSRKRPSFNKPLSIKTLTNRFFELWPMLAPACPETSC